MRVQYDPAANAAYLYLVDEIADCGVAFTYPCDPLEVRGMINLDFNADGQLVGIEVLDAHSKLPPELLGRA